MLIRSPEDLEKFKEIYEITEEISKEYQTLHAYYISVSIDRKQFVQRNVKTEFSKFEKYKAAIPHGGCVL